MEYKSLKTIEKMLLCLNVPVPVSTLYTYRLHKSVIHPESFKEMELDFDTIYKFFLGSPSLPNKYDSF